MNHYETLIALIPKSEMLIPEAKTKTTPLCLSSLASPNPVLAEAGPFTSQVRSDCEELWRKELTELEMAHTKGPDSA